MNTTSVSLLDRLKSAHPGESDWRRLQDIYLPLIRRWLGRIPGLGDEAEDLAQEIFFVVVREIPTFDRQRVGAFRSWLRQVTVNRVFAHRKRRGRRRTASLDADGGFLERLADPTDDLARQWDRDHDQHVFQKLLSAVRPDFNAATWEAFQRFAVEGRPAAQVAEELGLSENAVIKAKSRILTRLRQEAGHLLD